MKKRLKKLFKIAAIGTGVVFLLLAILITIGVIVIRVQYPPKRLKRIFKRQTAKYMNAEVDFDKITWKLLTNVKITGIKVSNPPKFQDNDDEYFFTMDAFWLKIDLSSLIYRRLILDKIILDTPFVCLKQKQGRWNFASLMKAREKADKPKKKKKKTKKDTGDGGPIKFGFRLNTLHLKDFSFVLKKGMYASMKGLNVELRLATDTIDPKNLGDTLKKLGLDIYFNDGFLRFYQRTVPRKGEYDEIDLAMPLPKEMVDLDLNNGKGKLHFSFRAANYQITKAGRHRNRKAQMVEKKVKVPPVDLALDLKAFIDLHKENLNFDFGFRLNQDPLLRLAGKVRDFMKKRIITVRILESAASLGFVNSFLKAFVDMDYALSGEKGSIYFKKGRILYPTNASSRIINLGLGIKQLTVYNTALQDDVLGLNLNTMLNLKPTKGSGKVTLLLDLFNVATQGGKVSPVRGSMKIDLIVKEILDNYSNIKTALHLSSDNLQWSSGGSFSPPMRFENRLEADADMKAETVRFTNDMKINGDTVKLSLKGDTKELSKTIYLNALNLDLALDDLSRLMPYALSNSVKNYRGRFALSGGGVYNQKGGSGTFDFDFNIRDMKMLSTAKTAQGRKITKEKLAFSRLDGKIKQLRVYGNGSTILIPSLAISIPDLFANIDLKKLRVQKTARGRNIEAPQIRVSIDSGTKSFKAFDYTMGGDLAIDLRLMMKSAISYAELALRGNSFSVRKPKSLEIGRLSANTGPLRFYLSPRPKRSLSELLSRTQMGSVNERHLTLENIKYYGKEVETNAWGKPRLDPKTKTPISKSKLKYVIDRVSLTPELIDNYLLIHALVVRLYETGQIYLDNTAFDLRRIQKKKLGPWRMHCEAGKVNVLKLLKYDTNKYEPVSFNLNLQSPGLDLGNYKKDLPKLEGSINMTEVSKTLIDSYLPIIMPGKGEAIGDLSKMEIKKVLINLDNGMVHIKLFRDIQALGGIISLNDPVTKVPPISISQALSNLEARAETQTERF